jgi:crotonobetainyl-CoA:carnitine CoA-transferase CaiB-like acyl-CoA transferase
VDVLVESFRPGTLDKWGLGRDRLAALHPGLVTCSLSGFGGTGPAADRVAHDLNLVAASGLLSLLPGGGLPKVQLADVTTGLLASSAILGALLTRHRTGQGLHIEQPLATGPLPFLTWVQADAAAGSAGLPIHLLGGDAPCYRVYTCADGESVALGAIEPKFWAEWVQAVGLPEIMGAGFDTGEAGMAAIRRLAGTLATQPAAHWVAIAEARNLPVTLVRDAQATEKDPYYAEHTSYMPSWPTPAGGRMPGPGADTARVLAEFGLA